MALPSSSSAPSATGTVLTASQFPLHKLFPSRVSLFPFPANLNKKSKLNLLSDDSASKRWRANISFFPAFLKKGKDSKVLKEELLEAVDPLDRGAEATLEDQLRVDQIARKLEGVNPTKEPLNSDLLNGKWELIYTTSQSILQTQRPKFLRPYGKIYQAINVDTLRAQNIETWPFFNQATANLVPLNTKRVAVKFDYFRIVGLLSEICI